MEEKINGLLDELAAENDVMADEIGRALITFAFKSFELKELKQEADEDGVGVEDYADWFRDYYCLSDLFSYIDTNEAEVLLGLTERFVKKVRASQMLISAEDLLEM